MQSSHRKITETQLLLTLSAVYFAFLLLILYYFGYTPTNDTDAYIDYAQTCIGAGEWYPCMAVIQGEPFIWHPGPINLIIVSLQWFHSLVPLLVLYCFLKALTAFALAKITELLFNFRTALIALILFVCYPNNWGQSTTLLSEIPMIAFCLLSVWLVLQYQKAWLMVLAGLSMALAEWFRPIAGIFIIALALQFLLFDRKSLWRKAVPFMAGFLLLICTIGARTYQRTGHFLYKGDSFWYNMADDAYDGATPDPHFGQPLFPEGTPRYIENRDQLTSFECSDIWKERCLAWLKTHPVEYLKKVPWRIYYMYQNDVDNISAFYLDKNQGENRYIVLPLRSLHKEYKNLSGVQWMALLATACYLFVMLCSLFGTVRLIRLHQWRKLFLPLFICAGGTIALVLLIQGETRFKAPYMPFYFMLAASWLSSIKKAEK